MERGGGGDRSRNSAGCQHYQWSGKVRGDYLLFGLYAFPIGIMGTGSISVGVRAPHQPAPRCLYLEARQNKAQSIKPNRVNTF